jgi:hypothetical protein
MTLLVSTHLGNVVESIGEVGASIGQILLLLMMQYHDNDGQQSGPAV